MTALEHRVVSAPGVPALRFGVRQADALPFAAVPTLRFGLGIEAEGGQEIRSILLDVQVQIAARRRGYAHDEQERLLELFGLPERWGTTLRTLAWVRTTLVVPAFTGSTVADLHVPCTYDLEVIAARYFAALEGGSVPLELLFSGSVFFLGSSGALQAVRLGSEHETEYDLPVRVWRQTMQQHFRDSAWVRLGHEPFRALCAYKARHAYQSWDAAIESLLGAEAGHDR